MNTTMCFCFVRVFLKNFVVSCSYVFVNGITMSQVYLKNINKKISETLFKEDEKYVD